MALPATVDVSLSWSNYKPANHGPFEIGGNLYVIMRNAAAGVMEAWKSTDGGDTWAEQDSANSIAGDGAFEAVLSGSTIYVALSVGQWHVRKFTSDAWVAAEAGMTTSPPTSNLNHISSQRAIHLIVRGAGDYVLLHQGPTEKLMGVNYRRAVYSRFQSGAWTNNVAVGPTGVEAHNDVRSAVLGSSTRSHLFYTKSSASTSLFHKSLTSGNTLNGEDTANSVNPDATSSYTCGFGVSYVDGADTKCVIPIRSSAGVGNRPYVLRFTSADTPSFAIQEVESSGSNDGARAVTIDSTTVHTFWAASADSDMYRDNDGGTGTWTGAAVEHRDAITLNAISIGKITDAIGIVYDDAGTIKYDKHALVVTPTDNPKMRRLWGVPHVMQGRTNIGRTWQ